MADKPKKTLKFQMMMSPEEAEILDDWMFKNRVRSRAEAIRRLCQMGIVADASKTMKLAMYVIAHYIKDTQLKPEHIESMKSGLPLEVDLKKLCWAVMEEQSKITTFKTDKIDEAIEAVKQLTEDFKNSAKGTHLDTDKK